MQVDENKKIILKTLAQCARDLRGRKSQFIHASESDISTSIISTIERGMKDPQLTTIFKLAESYNIKASELIKMIEEKLPANFHMIEK